MTKLALYVPLEAKPDKVEEAAAFIRGVLPLVEEESGTTAWFGVQTGPTTFAIFDAFPDEAARETHLNGKVAAALMGQVGILFERVPDIEKHDVLADKLPK